MHWASSIKPSSDSVSQRAEELKTHVKKIGGYLQLLIQGCDSEISSMVTEAHRRVAECMNVALKTIGFLAAVNGTHLLLTEHGSEIIDNRPVVDCLRDGIRQSVSDLLLAGEKIATEMHRDLSIQRSSAVDVAGSLQSYFRCCLSVRLTNGCCLSPSVKCFQPDND
ncbi:kinesin-like protein KIF14 [Puntigrus tetrazona]|uniref:kinesin-like protein KIF14 n=1 Tax=Puntigrus tetrazona TaxID=1606681 RepID=UPI001C89E3A8|nr:kinesin-like protein KIF14 [Puntigrus tetrazona]